jgi:phosphopantetheine adenylyltransferase
VYQKKGDTMSTKKLEEKVNHISSRMSSLRDEMVALQTELNSIVKKIEQDMGRIVTELKKK